MRKALMLAVVASVAVACSNGESTEQGQVSNDTIVAVDTTVASSEAAGDTICAH